MNITQQITNIMKYSNESRNSDKELWIIYAQKFGVNLSESQIKKIREMPSFETLRRVRQKLQSQGVYQADPMIKRERRHKSMVMQQTAPAFQAEQLEHTLDSITLPWGRL